jgi:nucleotide-binding universal stress UspA family protein
MSSSYSEIVVGSDGSETAERAVEVAATIAKQLDVRLTIASAWYRDMPDKPVMSELASLPAESQGAMEADWAETTVSDAAGIARKVGLEDIRTETPEGHAADVLIRCAADRPDSLLVVGAAGLGSRTERLLGNVPHQITHHSTQDVLLVRTDPRDETAYRAVALATDGSRTAAKAVRRGLAFARRLGATPTLVTAHRNDEKGEDVLDQVSHELGEELEREVLAGRNAAETLVEGAQNYDLLVIGNKGMSGPSRLLGSVANSVTHDVPTDLLLVNTT